MDDGCQVMAIPHMTLWVRWAKKLANQKQELTMVAMFVNGTGQNEQSLERTFHRCFLLSFTSFGWGVSEEKIKMWKVNGRQTTDAKWWQKLTLPLARWAKKGCLFFMNAIKWIIAENFKDKKCCVCISQTW